MNQLTIPRTVPQIPAAKAAAFAPVPQRELPDERFHIVEQIVTAPCHERRAALVLRVPDGILLQKGVELKEACIEADFSIGATYLDLRIAALCLYRDADGKMPAGPLQQLEVWRRGLVAFSQGRKA